MRDIRNPMVRSEGDRFWEKYCGFLDLSLNKFMAIQQALLLQQLQRLADCPLGRKLMGDKIPKSVDEFRNSVPLTSYNDYLPELEEENGHSLPGEPYVWAHTSYTAGSFKKVPYTRAFYDRLLDDLMAIFILSCSHAKGCSNIVEGDRVLFNVAPSPYLSGILASGASEKFNLTPVMSPKAHDDMDFKDKVAKGFEVSLRTGVDILIALTSVLVKMGRDFDKRSRKGRLSKLSSHPVVLYRLIRAKLLSKLHKRNIMPKDLWPVKAVIGWGMDTSIYRQEVCKYWGMAPYEFHACTEAGIIAMQSWSKKDMTFVPYSNFFEFIPESELLPSNGSGSHQPRTVLISEVKPGERYELVVTGFHGQPLVRYRLGHLIKITSLQDEKAQVYLPQMVFEGRVDDLLDIAGFTRVSEKTVAQAIANAGLDHAEWSIRKEAENGDPKLHLYMELDNRLKPAEVTSSLHQELKKIDCFYNDLDTMMDIRPLEVTMLRPGTFSDYYEETKKLGMELPLRKPPRMNAPDDVINKLVLLSIKKS